MVFIAQEHAERTKLTEVINGYSAQSLKAYCEINEIVSILITTNVFCDHKAERTSKNHPPYFSAFLKICLSNYSKHMFIFSILKTICGEAYFKSILGNLLHYLVVADRAWDKNCIYSICENKLFS